MRDLMVYGVELVVGIACLVGGAAFWRNGSRLIGLILLVAGAAAAIHAIAAWIT